MVATERLFFAVRPDAATAQRIESLAQHLRRLHGLRGKSLGPERFHVTLHLIGDFAAGIPTDVQAGALEAARPVAADASPFSLGFDKVASFTRKRRNMPLVLLAQDGAEDLARMQRSLVSALTRAGLAGRSEPLFTPHLTLLYDDLALIPQSIELVSWRVDELLLVRSLLGRGRHEVLGRVPLAGPSLPNRNTDVARQF